MVKWNINKARRWVVLIAILTLLSGCGGGGDSSSGGTAAGPTGGTTTGGTTPIVTPTNPPVITDWNSTAVGNQPLAVAARPVKGVIRRAGPDPATVNQFEPAGAPNGAGASDGAWVAWHTDADNPSSLNYTIRVGSYDGSFEPGNPHARLASEGVALFGATPGRKHQFPAVEAFSDFSALVVAESNESGGGNVHIAAARLLDNGNGTTTTAWTTDTVSGSSGEQRFPRSAANTARTVLITFWNEQGGTPGIACQRFNTAGPLGGNIVIDTGDCRISDIEGVSGGTVVSYDKRATGGIFTAHAALVADNGTVTAIVLSDMVVSAQTGTLTNGSTVVSGLASTSGLASGLRVIGTGIRTGATIASVDSATQVTLNLNATTTGNETLVFRGDASFPQIDSATEGGVEFLYSSFPDSRSGGFRPFGNKHRIDTAAGQWLTNGVELDTVTVQGTDRGIDVVTHSEGGASYLMEEIAGVNSSVISSRRQRADGSTDRGRVAHASITQQFTLPSALLDTGQQFFGLWNGSQTVNFNAFGANGNGLAAADPLAFGATTSNARRKIQAVPLGNGRLFTCFEEIRSGKSQVVGRIPHR